MFLFFAFVVFLNGLSVCIWHAVLLSFSILQFYQETQRTTPFCNKRTPNLCPHLRYKGRLLIIRSFKITLRAVYINLSVYHKILTNNCIFSCKAVFLQYNWNGRLYIKYTLCWHTHHSKAVSRYSLLDTRVAVAQRGAKETGERGERRVWR